MAQTFENIPSSDTLKDSRKKILDRTDAAASSFSGIAFPVTTWAGQAFLNTATNILYMRNFTDTGWTQIADLSSTNLSSSAASILYAPISHSHGGGDITSQVADAATADLAADATKLGNVAASNYARKDAESVHTVDVVMNDSISQYFGTGKDFHSYYSGSYMYYRGRPGAQNTRVYFQAYDGSGINKTMFYARPDGAFYGYYAGALKFNSTSTGFNITGTLVTDTGKLGTNGTGTKTVSTAAPSGTGHVDGDTWCQY